LLSVGIFGVQYLLVCVYRLVVAKFNLLLIAIFGWKIVERLSGEWCVADTNVSIRVFFNAQNVRQLPEIHFLGSENGTSCFHCRLLVFCGVLLEHLQCVCRLLFTITECIVFVLVL
jgi:hypothetical protein